MAVSLEEGIQENNKLVHYVAKRFQKRAAQLRIEYDDLISEGMIGLIKALQKFDESYGVKFSTYAVPMIEGQIRRFFRDTNPGPRFSRLAKELGAKLTGEETVIEIIEKFHVSKWRAEEALAYKTNNSTFSIDMKLNDHEDKDLTLLDLIEYREDFSSVEIDEFLSTLPTKLKRVAHLAMKDLKQQEIADKIGCSQVEVSRRLKKIRDLYQEYFGRGNEGMNLKHIRLRIHNLIDQHGDSFDKCQGCLICTEIKRLRKGLERDSTVKFKHILDKGPDMTKSDIAFLLDNDVDLITIRKAAGIPTNDFNDMIFNFGFSKRRKPKEEVEMKKITLEEYQDLKAKGLSDKQIAAQKNIHPNYLPSLKKQWFKNGESPVETAKKAAEATIEKLKHPEPVKAETKEQETKPVQTPKQPSTAVVKAPEPKPIGEAINEALNEAFAEKSAEYERLIAALRSDLNTAHQQLDEKDEKIRNLEHLHAAFEDTENELMEVRQAKEELEKKLILIQEAAKQTNTNYLEAAKKLKPLEEENQAMRLLIKKWA